MSGDFSSYFRRVFAHYAAFHTYNHLLMLAHVLRSIDDIYHLCPSQLSNALIHHVNSPSFAGGS